MAQLRFTKMQGIGNDFVVVDARDAPGADWPRLAPRLCDRRFGVGSDGILEVSAPDAPGADARMRMWNPDGTEDGCGNGMRCVVRYAVERMGLGRPAPDGTVAIALDTISGPRGCVWHAGSATAEVEMGPPRFHPAELPMEYLGDAAINVPIRVAGEEVPVTVVNTGSTHAVVLVQALPGDTRFARLSAAIERDAMFPERTSVMWARVDSPEHLRLRIWERAIGETWGCGTGACAAAVAAQTAGLMRDTVHVRSAGGMLVVTWRPGEDVVQRGPAEFIFEGSWPM